MERKIVLLRGSNEVLNNPNAWGPNSMLVSSRNGTE